MTDADPLEQSSELIYRTVRMLSPAAVDQVRPEDRLAGDLAYDSLRMLELACVLDDLFSLHLASPDDAPMTATVGALLDYVAQRLTTGKATCPDAAQAEAVLRDLVPAE